ncbi:MAG: thermonuclease family protein [Myxococcales bacterium]|nr:thermonuclease family protein [Myxococcales bacterium]
MVDTPEISHNSSEVAECYADEAKQFNEDLVAGQTISLVYDTECTDDYERLLAYVSIGDREINSLLVERGFACVLHIPPNGADRASEFETLESLAEEQGRGLWGACESKPC